MVMKTSYLPISSPAGPPSAAGVETSPDRRLGLVGVGRGEEKGGGMREIGGGADTGQSTAPSPNLDPTSARGVAD